MIEPTFTDFILFPAKECSSCHTALPANRDFYTPKKSRPDGLNTECRACKCERERRRYAEDPAARESKRVADQRRRVRTVRS